ncbi:hypothetical protein ACPV3A_29540 [Paenibacillus sp. Dod16]|uniref:hypothetical protein n=1 Tax=Paenibacillus sp. Dod16 TaxID=3416392 RepID=UPI003CFBBFC7
MHAREREAIYKAIQRYIDGENFPHSQLRTLVSKLFESEQETRRELTELEQEYDELFNQKSAIPWIKYDPENPPEKGMYFVIHIGGITSASIKSEGWQSYNGHWLYDVTHYAVINLPGEETTE